MKNDNHNETKGFSYTYSAREQAELKRIRDKYTAPTETEIVADRCHEAAEGSGQQTHGQHQGKRRQRRPELCFGHREILRNLSL